jgi:hypothetical protein
MARFRRAKQEQTRRLVEEMLDVHRRLSEAYEGHWTTCLTSTSFEAFEADIGVSARDELLN